ncbi:hypothetical protein ETX26_13060 [Pelagerythrobacter rhizovicinus]|uniref:Uncharacterized protein n=1 Tax=Pelagerythrobacter rhizovicinus TaxID=2268576 RepID=A0A4Q2KKA8_9SPHN|nr:hypothetical protein ETX26_13060 [Pelagerythrobacter rhizovicinus]
MCDRRRCRPRRFPPKTPRRRGNAPRCARRAPDRRGSRRARRPDRARPRAAQSRADRPRPDPRR